MKQVSIKETGPDFIHPRDVEEGSIVAMMATKKTGGFPFYDTLILGKSEYGFSFASHNEGTDYYESIEEACEEARYGVGGAGEIYVFESFDDFFSWINNV